MFFFFFFFLFAQLNVANLQRSRRGGGWGPRGRGGGRGARKVRAPHPSSDKQTVRGLTGLRCVKSSSCAERRGGNRGAERGLGESACVCPAASEESGWAPRPASSRAETRPPSPSAGTRREADWGADAQVKPHCPPSPPQESGSPPRLGSRPGVGPPSGYCTADRGASPASPAAIPSLRLQGKRLSLSGPPGWGQREAPRRSELAPSVDERIYRVLSVCLFFIPLHPQRQVRLLQTQMRPRRGAGPQPGQWAPPWRRRPRVPTPQPRPCILNWLLGH